MESRAKIFGHPVHPILIVFPLGLLATALGLDVAYALTHRAGLAAASYWNIDGAHLDAPSSLTGEDPRAAGL